MTKNYSNYFLHFKLNAFVLVLIVFCLFPRMSTMAQKNLNTLTLNAVESTDQIHTACKKIVLGTGYRFSSKSGKSMHAYIDPVLVCDVHYENIDRSSGEPEEDPIFSNTNEVGTTAGEFAVSPTGGATYTIPIIVPPGTMGMVPHLAVSYNSQAGDGLLGIGWNLSGLSAISRTTQTLYHDNNISPVSLTNEDRFVLDGARLIATGTNDAGGSTYGTEAESFVRVNSIGQKGNGPDHFTVETKDGSTLEYGNSDDSRIEASGNETVLTWLLYKVTDVHGNYMKIYYTEGNGNGEFRPDYIEYTRNDKASPVLAPYNRVKFIYSERQDKQLAYVAGSQVKQSVVLTEVHTYDASGYQAHEYDFNYTYDMGSHLSGVVERGCDGKQYNSIRFEHDKVDDIKPVVTPFPYLNSKPGQFLPVDFNGDGFSDILQINAGNWFLHSNNFSSSISMSILQSGNINGQNLYLALNQDNASSVDLNGDGLEDVLIYSGQSIDILGRQVNNATFYPLFSDKTTGTLQNNNVQIASGFTGASKYTLGDFDGDGATDIFIYYYDNDFWFFHSFKRNVGYSGHADWGDKNLNFYPAVDMNGDGKQEVMFTFNNPWTKTSYYLTLELKETAGQGALTIKTGGYPSGYHKIYPGDFNGDGKTDILTWSSSIGWEIGYSTGNGFTAVPAPLKNSGDPRNSTHNEYIVADFNGDGKQDILDKYILSNSVIVLNTYYSTGEQFIENHTAYPYWFNEIGNSYVGDFDGDGHSDIIYKNGNNGSASLISFIQNKDIHKVKQITNGLNHNTKIEYNTLPLLAVQGTYSKGHESVFPVIDFQKAIPVVSQSEQDDGIGTTNKTIYSYSGAKIHLQGKGFLGFSKVTTIDDARKTKVENNYDAPLSTNFFQSNLHQSTISLIDNSGNVVSGINDKLFQYTTNSLGGVRYYTYLNELDDNDQLHGNTTTSTFSQDVNGNPQDQSSVNSAGTSYTHNDFEQIGGSGSLMFALVKTSTTVTRGSSPPYSRSSTFTNNSSGMPLSKTEDGLNLVTTYIYDANEAKLGNLKSITSSGTDIASATTTNVYDPKGRFVILQTNALGHTTSMTYDNAYGNVLKKTDPNLLSTQYVYDGFGRLKQSITPSNQQINIARTWETGSAISNASFKVETTETGMPTQTEHFDILGRTLQTQTTGFDGAKINVDNVYNGLGQLVSQSEPYYNGTPLKTSYSYDDFQRIETVNAASGGVIKYTNTYGTNITSTVFTATGVPAKTVIKTLDASGALVSVNDAGGNLVYTYHSCGKPLTITIPGTNKKVRMDYDAFGRQISLNDPDAGLIGYTYDALGQLLSQTDALHNTYTMTYDELGRVSTKIKEGNEASSIKYLYDDKTHGKGMLSSVTSVIGFNGIKADYTYDPFSRLKDKTEKNIDGADFVSSYEYDNFDRLIKETYPHVADISNDKIFAISNTYNTYGYLEKISKGDNLIWQCTEMNERGQIAASALGNGLNSTKEYDPLGYLQHHKLTNGFNIIKDYAYVFEPTTGNLTSRGKTDALSSLTENFIYDNLDRLKNIGLNGYNITMNYAPSGNIDARSDVGIYFYGSSKPHAVAGINNFVNPIPISIIPQDISYTTFNKVSTIIEGINEADVFYGPDLERKKMQIKKDGALVFTKYYLGNYEKTITINQQPATNNYTRELHYIASPDGLCAIYVRNNTNGTEVDSMYYIHTDHLGSIALISDKDGNVLEENSYDAWGRRRNPATWDFTGSFGSKYFDRGYTGHEHLPQFGLINMNGRMYDPLLGRMLSPDNYVQFGDYTQAYNRYGYAYNNPLRYTDPDGEWIQLVIGAAIGGTVNWLANGAQWNNQGLAYFGVGALAGALGAGIGGGISSALAGGSFGAGFLGTSSAMVASSSFISGAAIGSGAGFSSGFTTGFGNGLIQEQSFNDALISGGEGGLIGGLSGGLIGGIGGGINAYRNDRDFWTGKLPSGGDDRIWGEMTIKARGAGKGSSSTDGHSWIEVTNGSNGETTSYGTWGNQGDQEFMTNFKGDLNSHYDVLETQKITFAQKARLDNFTGKDFNRNWTIFRNCSSFSSRAFNYTTGLNIMAHPFMSPIFTPSWLVRTLH